MLTFTLKSVKVNNYLLTFTLKSVKVNKYDDFYTKKCKNTHFGQKSKELSDIPHGEMCLKQQCDD